MADWITPKTNWKASDYFNLNPDYNRIKGNIQWVKDFSAKMYAEFPLFEMKDFTIDNFPFESFLNSIVDNVAALETNLFKPLQNKDMDRYASGEPGWDYNQLNIIEGNLLRLRSAMESQWNAAPMLPFILGIGDDDF